MEKKKMNLALTLIELLITVTIIFTLSGLSIAYYNNFTQEQQLKNEAKKFNDVLELAKKKTLTGDLSNQTCNNFNGYQITTMSNNNQNPDYRFSLCCNSSCSDPIDINSFNFPDHINFQQNSSFLFLPLTAKLNRSDDLNLTIKNNSINKCLQITISPFGIITLNEVLTSC